MADDISITVNDTNITLTVTGGGTWDGLSGKPEATAESDFITANSSLAWVKKTLAQVKTILGLGSASQVEATAENDFIFASGAGAFEKKTFAQLRTLLNTYYYYAGGSIVETVIIPAGFMERTFANPLAIDLSLSRDFKCSSVTGSTTINLSNVNDGRAGMIVLIVDGTGGYTLTLGAAFTLALNSTALSGLANKKNFISYVCFGSDVIYTVNVI